MLLIRYSSVGGGDGERSSIGGAGRGGRDGLGWAGLGWGGGHVQDYCTIAPKCHS